MAVEGGRGEGIRSGSIPRSNTRAAANFRRVLDLVEGSSNVVKIFEALLAYPKKHVKTKLMTDNHALEDMTVEELRAHLHTMRQLMESSATDGLNLSIDSDGNPTSRSRRPQSSKASKASIIDGTFLSLVFSVVLFLIVGVSFYAFQNLYQAILKKFPSLTHTEL